MIVNKRKQILSTNLPRPNNNNHHPVIVFIFLSFDSVVS